MSCDFIFGEIMSASCQNVVETLQYHWKVKLVNMNYAWEPTDETLLDYGQNPQWVRLEHSTYPEVPATRRFSS
jgi:hypothetical protein